jgi:hypothetical protein
MTLFLSGINMNYSLRKGLKHLSGIAVPLYGEKKYLLLK